MIGILLNAGRFHAELTRLSREETVPLFGSSANLSGSGTRFRVEDIQDEIKSIADVIVDHGLRRAHAYRRAGTLINFDTMKVVRIGAYYDVSADTLKRFFGVELPPDPGAGRRGRGWGRHTLLVATSGEIEQSRRAVTASGVQIE